MNKPQRENSSFARRYITETLARKPTENYTILRNLKYSSIINSCLLNKSHYVILKTCKRHNYKFNFVKTNHGAKIVLFPSIAFSKFNIVNCEITRAILVWEQVYSRGKFVLKASHWSRNVHWDIVVVKSFGGKFATCSDGNYRGLKFSPTGANMKTRLESKIVCNSRKQAVLLTKFGCNIHLAALSKFLIYFCSIRGHVTF